MDLNNKISEVLSGLNVDLNDIDTTNVNLLTNQVFSIFYEADKNTDYSVIYSSIIHIVSNTIHSDDIVSNFDKYRHKINQLNQVRDEHYKNIEVIDNIQKEIMFEKVKHLKTLFQPKQRSPEWYAIRETLCTASADTYDIIQGNQNKVILKKCGLGPAFHGNRYTWHGCKYEDIAIGIYESRYSRKVWEFGLIQHPTIKCLGASPDGITTCGRMLEIKCPSGRVINGKIKPVYFCQMQTQMEVCDLDVCDFFEADIKQYRDFESYQKDIFEQEDIYFLDIIPRKAELDFIKVPNDRRSSNGLEKGMIGSYGPHPGEMKHIFPPFNVSSNEQHKWMLNKKEEFSQKGIELIIDYWWLETSSLNIIKRDRQWWEDKQITKKLYDTWDKIYEARKTENGTDKYLSKKKYNEKYNIDQGKTIDLTDLFGVEEKSTTPNMENDLLNLNTGCLLSFSDDDCFTIDEPKPKKKIKKVKKVKKVKVKKVKKIKKVKIVKKKKKKKKVIEDADCVDEDLMSMIGCLCIDSDDD